MFPSWQSQSANNSPESAAENAAEVLAANPFAASAQPADRRSAATALAPATGVPWRRSKPAQPRRVSDRGQPRQLVREPAMSVYEPMAPCSRNRVRSSSDGPNAVGRQPSNMVDQTLRAFGQRAVRAAEEAPVRLHTVADDPALTVLADRCQPMNGAFEAVEYVPGALRLDRECHRVLVAANLTLGHSAMICASYRSAIENDVPVHDSRRIPAGPGSNITTSETDRNSRLPIKRHRPDSVVIGSCPAARTRLSNGAWLSCVALSLRTTATVTTSLKATCGQTRFLSARNWSAGTVPGMSKVVVKLSLSPSVSAEPFPGPTASF